MKKINTAEVAEEAWTSPKGRFASFSRGLSIGLGREPASMDLTKRHPFDVEICRVPAGKALCPYHSHSAQWEFYHVISGNGIVRDKDGNTEVGPGDAFVFEPGSPHQITGGDSDLVVYIIADNPVGETCHYPDSGKWLVRSPERTLIRSDPLKYLDGEE